MNSQRLITAANLCFAYQKKEKPLFSNLSFTLDQGQILGIVGLSGSGKSTLCQILAGIITNYQRGHLSGELFIKGQAISQLKISQLSQIVGLVFQDPQTQLFTLTVEEELAFGPENLNLSPQIIKNRIEKALKAVGISHLQYRQINQLSGGEAHLTALAAVLTLEPEILILDEVMSSLDQQNRFLISKIIQNLSQENKGIIIVDHQSKNLSLASQIIDLSQYRG